jgi:GT2 family glycosyltransferase
MTVEHTLVVPIHNGAEFIHLFWHSLLPNLLPNSELLLIDDGSNEDIRQLVPTFPATVDSRVFRNDTPQGYARAVNRALATARGTYIYLLNTDLILGDGALALMHAYLEKDARVGVVGAKLLYPQTGKIQHVGLAFSPTRKLHIFTHMHPDHVLVNVLREVQAVTFALCGMRRQLLDEIGPLDSEYCNGSEDIDLSLRARTRGYRNIVPCEVASFHWESLSGDDARHATTAENEARFWGRWASSIETDIGSYIGESSRVFFASHPQLREARYTVVNFTPGGDVQYLLAAFLSELPHHAEFAFWDYARVPHHRGQIWLAMALPFDAIRSPRPFVFIVHEYPQLLQNNYWFAQRRRFCADDIVVDHYGNIVRVNDPAFSSGAVRQKSAMDVS